MTKRLFNWAITSLHSLTTTVGLFLSRRSGLFPVGLSLFPVQSVPSLRRSIVPVVPVVLSLPPWCRHLYSTSVPVVLSIPPRSPVVLSLPPRFPVVLSLPPRFPVDLSM
ncbi:hypothetical protein ACFE04_015815 [Oxalis oulophora]